MVPRFRDREVRGERKFFARFHARISQRQSARRAPRKRSASDRAGADRRHPTWAMGGILATKDRNAAWVRGAPHAPAGPAKASGGRFRAACAQASGDSLGDEVEIRTSFKHFVAPRLQVGQIASIGKLERSGESILGSRRARRDRHRRGRPDRGLGLCGSRRTDRARPGGHARHRPGPQFFQFRGPDVAAAFPNAPHAEASGFAIQLANPPRARFKLQLGSAGA